MNSTPSLRDGHPVEYAAARFLELFHHVFHNDWEHTRVSLRDVDSYVERTGTFLVPGKDNWDDERNEEANNWCSRAVLLDAYRELSETLMARGFHPNQRDPDELNL